MSDKTFRANNLRTLGFLSVMTFGAVADGVTDDRTAIQDAVTAAATLGCQVYFPPGHYRVSKYVDVANATGLRIFGDTGATIHYPSDDTSVVPDSVATSAEMARSAFLMRYCTGVVVDGLTFHGESGRNLENNVGHGIYATRCVGTTVFGCTGIEGYSLFAQDATTGTNGSGDSLAVSAGVVTITDAAALFKPGHVGHQIILAGATTPANDGVFIIASYISPTQITIENAVGVTEAFTGTWTIDDSDRGTRIECCQSLNERGFFRTGNDSIIRDNLFERPGTVDAAGIGDSFAISGTTVTLTDAAARFKPQHVGKIIQIATATSGANNGSFRITAWVSATQIRYENAAGVAEAFSGTWWIANGDKVGLGVSLAKSGSTMTLTSATAAFDAGDVGKVVRVANPPSAGNNTAAVITAVLGPTQLQFENASGVAEAWTGAWSIDGYDNGISAASETYGSTHAIYIFAGRSNILIEGNTFKYIRTVCVKVSGSSLPITNIVVRNNYAIECGAFFIGGADDAQEHTGMVVEGNTLIDCGTSNPGRSQATGIGILGSRGTLVRDNYLYYTRDAIGSLDGRGFGSNVGIVGSRYTTTAQPVEDLTIDGNRFESDPSSTRSVSALAFAIRGDSVGIRAKYRTGGSLTKTGSTMVLSDSSAKFSWQDVGKPITLVNSAGGNDGTFTVTRVANTTTLEFVNAAGTGGGVSAGTYRIADFPNRRSGYLRISNNYIDTVASSCIETVMNVGTDIIGNTIANGLIRLTGDVSPRISMNRCLAMNSQNALIRISAGTSWPTVTNDNTITNNGIGITSGRDMSIGTGSAPVDYPLLGVRGRVRPSNGIPEAVVAYGYGHVDGDTISVNGVVYTYKTTAPAGNQFNSFAGLVALIAAQANIDCVDYGTGFAAGNVATQHMKISYASVQTNNALISIGVSALNPTALVMLRNTGGANQLCQGRGAASTGPVADKTVVWSPLCSFSGGVILWPDNAAAQTLLQAGGYRPVKNSDDAGCDEVLTHNASAGTEEFRWGLAG